MYQFPRSKFSVPSCTALFSRNAYVYIYILQHLSTAPGWRPTTHLSNQETINYAVPSGILSQMRQKDICTWTTFAKRFRRLSAWNDAHVLLEVLQEGSKWSFEKRCHWSGDRRGIFVPGDTKRTSPTQKCLSLENSNIVYIFLQVWACVRNFTL